MENPEFFKDYSSFAPFSEGRFGKANLFEAEHILAGLNYLEPGQELEKHARQVQSCFYIVLEGKGQVQVGDSQKETEKGTVIWVPPGYTHRIVNTGAERLVLLMGITATCDG